MTPEPTSYLLDGLQGWRQQHADGVVQGRAGDREVLELAPSIQSPAGRGFLRRGVWISQPLDSGITACLWHRVELTVSLPEGCSVRVSTHTAEKPARSACPPVSGPSWQEAFVAGGAPAGYRGHLVDSPGFPLQEGLVQSRSGRWLSLRLELFGDLEKTPRIEAIRIHFPRRTWLEFLPAVFSNGQQRRWFLDRFLSIFHTPWAELETQVATFYRYLDPRATPDDFLPNLAAWLGQPLEGGWQPAENRRLLAATPALLPRRGTPAALRRFGRIYLANFSGLTPRAVWPFPILVEHQRRRWSEDGRCGGETQGLRLGHGPALVSEGSSRGEGGGDRHVRRPPPYGFDLIVPEDLLPPGDLPTFRRAIEQEKPAPTWFQVRRIARRTVIGCQSRVGVDTFVGGPRARRNHDRAA